MPPSVATRVDDDVAVVTIDNPPVNALSPKVVSGLRREVTAAASDPAVKAIVIVGAGRTFVAGADIKVLERLVWGDESGAPDMHDTFRDIEDCAKPVVMAIHGTALGGGLELAMAGHYRVASADAKLGQPEANLGLIPGAEGTQRLPRLVGVPKALEMCVTGKPISAREALEAGLVDRMVDGDVVAGAVALARGRAPGGLPRTRERTSRLPPANEVPALLESARALAATARRHEEAPRAAVEAVAAAAMMPFDEGCLRERELFLACARSDQAKALIYAFFAERAVAKRLGKVGVVSSNAGDLVRTRLLVPYVNEAQVLAEEGASAEQVDRALADFGMARGLFAERAIDVRARTTSAHDTRTARRAIPDEEIVERLVLTLVNEGARVLQEGVVGRAADIDVISVIGHGFPAFRGGPMFYADRLGLPDVLSRVSALHAAHGARWQPAPLLEQLAREGRTFRQLDADRD